jgi:ribosomal protein S24E
MSQRSSFYFFLYANMKAVEEKEKKYHVTRRKRTQVCEEDGRVANVFASQEI